jgi:GntR family transcriptional regulator
MTPKARPQFKQIADGLRESINRGEYPRGAALPTERDLAARHGVSAEIINRAVRILRTEGLVRVIYGRGAIVHPVPPIPRGAVGRYSKAAREEGGGRGAFSTEIRRLGFEPRSDLVQVGTTDDVPEAVAEILGIEPGQQAVIRARQMYADTTPVQIATSYLPIDVAGGTVLETADSGVGGIYSRLTELGYAPARFTERVRTRPPADDEAAFLQLDADQPMYEILHTAWTEEERPVEVCVHLMPVHQWILDYEWPADER